MADNITAGSKGDTGIRFCAWYNVASEMLMQAARDNDPACIEVFCQEARIACGIATDRALNNRQQAMTKALQTAIDAVELIAQNTPPLAVPHDHSAN